MKKVLSVATGVAFGLISLTAAANQGGAPALPCYSTETGEMIHSSLVVYECEKLGGTLTAKKSSTDVAAWFKNLF